MCSYLKMLPGALGRYLLNVSGWTPNLKKQSGLMVTTDASEYPDHMVADTSEDSMSKGRCEISNEAFSEKVCSKDIADSDCSCGSACSTAASGNSTSFSISDMASESGVSLGCGSRTRNWHWVEASEEIEEGWDGLFIWPAHIPRASFRTVSNLSTDQLHRDKISL